MAEERDLPERRNGADSELNRAEPKAPVQPLNEEQLRQFQQFQQFQEYQAFQRSQGGPQAGDQGPAPTGPPPSAPYPYPPPPPAPTGTASGFPKMAAPPWLKKLGAKIISMFLLLIVLIIAGKLVYNHFFPSDNGKTSEQLAAEGGGTYHTNNILPHDPYNAVRSVYEAIAKDPSNRACYLFDDKARQKFATDLGFADCAQAVAALHSQVTHVNDYAESLPSYRSGEPTGDTLTVHSCNFTVTGGPALGSFTATKVEMGQWLIIDHAPDPNPCPPLPNDPDLPMTWPSHPTTSINYPTTSYQAPPTN